MHAIMNDKVTNNKKLHTKPKTARPPKIKANKKRYLNKSKYQKNPKKQKKRTKGDTQKEKLMNIQSNNNLTKHSSSVNNILCITT